MDPTEGYVFNHTMLRVKDIQKSLYFYRECLGMTLVRESNATDFSLYFLAKLTSEQKLKVEQLKGDELISFMRTGNVFYLELTHNHGTEQKKGQVYKNGNTDDSRGFGHIAFTVPNLSVACDRLLSMGVQFRKLPHEGTMQNIAFAYDPDMYWVELIQQT
jgi:lactoylglutathione lyase